MNQQTDYKPGEPVILEPLRYADLRIANLEGQHIETIPAPVKGRTHEALKATAQQPAAKTSLGADAYLGDSSVGSTEVLSVDTITKENKVFAKAGAAICLITFLVFLYWKPVLALLTLLPLLSLLLVLTAKVGYKIKVKSAGDGATNAGGCDGGLSKL